MIVPSNWWQTFFQGMAVDLWLRCTTDEQTRPEADFLQKNLRLVVPAKVLDVPCGGGRHAIELAARGFDVTGVDLAPEFLAHARTAATQRKVSVAWQQRDMRDLPWQGEFDGACCLGNSFAYLDDDGNPAFLQAVARALKPRGRFLIDTGVVAESILPNFQERRWYEVGPYMFLIHNHHNLAQSRLESQLTFIRDGKVEKRAIAQRIYTFRELSRLMQEAGFADLEAFAGLDQEPYRLGAQQLFLVATKV